MIAINYPARKYGLNRFIPIAEAKKLCPNLILQHVATWKEGDEKWAYHDALAHVDTHKVSLDPYRLESRRILACIKDVLPAPPIQKVEKASVDEVFLDLSAQIHSILLERYPEISGPAPYDDPTEFLPRPPTTALDWNTDALVDLDESETEDDDPDWDDIAMLIGSEIIRSVRAAIRERLKYTCSAGIARNKMLAKLGSAHKKPNQQTIVRNRAVQHFMADFKFTRIRNLGGKLGDEVVAKFATDEVKELLAVPIEQLKSKLGDDTGSWVYCIIRGDDSSEVNARTQIKSMLSAKSFRPTINSSEQATRWLRIFVADIQSRLVEEGVLENKRRPRTLNLHHRQGGQMRSRQAPIPTGRSIDEALLFDLAKNLLAQIAVDGRAWPCGNLQLSVGGFEDGPTGNQGIGGFLIRGEEAKAMKPSMRDPDDDRRSLSRDEAQAEKRRKMDRGVIQHFFPKPKREVSYGESGDCSEDADVKEEPVLTSSSPHGGNAAGLDGSDLGLGAARTIEDGIKSQTRQKARATDQHQHASTTSFVCDRCHSNVADSAKEEHDDWHFARDLQAQEQEQEQETSAEARPRPEANLSAKTHFAEGRRFNRPKASSNGFTQKRIQKGQSQLTFGR